VNAHRPFPCPLQYPACIPRLIYPLPWSSTSHCAVHIPTSNLSDCISVQSVVSLPDKRLNCTTGGLSMALW
jgi:hypothetical protein